MRALDGTARGLMIPMGFFRDLFGPSKPCDLCQLGQSSWPKTRNAVADWKLRGHGLQADLFICAPCYRGIKQLHLTGASPMLALVEFVRIGHATRPAPHAYLQHPEWKKVWMHTLDMTGTSVPDEFAALEVIKQLEASLFSPDNLAYQRRHNMEFLWSIGWGSSKAKVRAHFLGYDELPPHPTLDAIGFVGQSYGVPITVVCYFIRGILRPKLARVVVAFFEERPNDEEVETLYLRIRDDLIKRFGEPYRRIAPRASPVEFRHSGILVWALRKSVLTLSLSLLRDGVRPDSGPLAIGYGDAKADPASKDLVA